MAAQAFETDTFKSEDGTTISITFFKHATLMIQFGDCSIQVDPMAQYVDYSAYPKADLILITHEHGDHLDSKAITTLEEKETVLLGTKVVCEQLKKGKTLANGDKFAFRPNISIEAVPAYNTTAGRENFHPKGRGNGYVLSLGGFKIYIAGDTEDIPEMKNLKDINVAFLPVNQPNTMTVAQTINATKMFNPKVLYPYHYRDSKVEDIAGGLDGKMTEVRVRFKN